MDVVNTSAVDTVNLATVGSGWLFTTSLKNEDDEDVSEFEDECVEVCKGESPESKKCISLDTVIGVAGASGDVG